MSESLMQKMKRLQTEQTVAANQNTATQTTTNTQQYEATEHFAITEAEIKQNSAYQIATDTSKSLKQRVEELIALRVYNPELSPEENAENLEAVKETLIYFENSIMQAAEEANQFTHDDALSLFDDTVKTLQGRLKTYQNYITPFVKALNVLGEAREQGIPTADLLQEVQDLKDKGAKATALKDQKLEEIGHKKAEIEPIQGQVNDLFQRLKGLDENIASSNKVIENAQNIINVQNATNFLFRNRKALKAAKETQSLEQWKRKGYLSGKESVAEQSKVAASTLARLSKELEELQSEIKTLEHETTEANSALTQDEDTAAISRLLEITGEAFKEEREKITDLISAISKDSVTDLENTAARFQSGHAELTTVSGKVSNVADFNQVVFEASTAAKDQDDSYAEELKATIAKIEAEKGEDAKLDPDYEIAKNQLRALNRHDKNAMSFTEQSGQIAGLISGQLSSFEATATAFQQKQADCRRLRTETSVKTSTQTMTTLKALELATASEKLGVTDELLGEIGATSTDALRGIFDNVTRNLDTQNDRQAQAIKDALVASMEIDKFSQDIRERVKEGDIGRRALNDANVVLDDHAQKLGSVAVEATRDVAADPELQEKVDAAALAAFERTDDEGKPSEPSM